MSTYLCPKVLDRWVSILATLRFDKWSSYGSTHSGGGMKRIRELINAGLIHARLGRNGGYRLALPLSEMTLGHLLAIFPREPCPTIKLFYLHRQISIKEIIGWKEIPVGAGKASIESVIAIVARLSLTQPTAPETLSDLSYSLGYTQQIFATLTKLGLLQNYQRKGKILVKPFDGITLGEIAPALSHRGHIHATLVSRSGQVKLRDIQLA